MKADTLNAKDLFEKNVRYSIPTVQKRGEPQNEERRRQLAEVAKQLLPRGSDT